MFRAWDMVDIDEAEAVVCRTCSTTLISRPRYPGKECGSAWREAGGATTQSKKLRAASYRAA